MKNNILKIFSIIVLFTFSHITLASITADKCTNLEGNWRGKGDVKLFILSCGYEADVKIGEGNPADVSFTARKVSGSFLCPNNINYDLVGACDNGLVTIKNDVVDLSGKVSDDKKQMDIEGTVEVFYKKHPIKASLQR